MARSNIAGPQFGGRQVRDRVELPTTAKISLRRMSTGDLKVARAILSEEIRIAFAPFKAHAMKAQLSRIREEITRRNLRDLKAGRINWTRPRHQGRELSVSLAEAARVS